MLAGMGLGRLRLENCCVPAGGYEKGEEFTMSTNLQSIGQKVEIASERLSTGMAHIGKSLVVKGELSASEDLSIEGRVEGTIELKEHNLTIGPSGRTQANVNAKEVVVLGSLQGNVNAPGRIEIRKSGSVTGDLVTARLQIDEGAHFKGSIDIKRTAEPGGKSK
jgi:cytoskeletal protein CcmA (bactofilin family)